MNKTAGVGNGSKRKESDTKLNGQGEGLFASFVAYLEEAYQDHLYPSYQEEEAYQGAYQEASYLVAYREESHDPFLEEVPYPYQEDPSLEAYLALASSYQEGVHQVHQVPYRVAYPDRVAYPYLEVDLAFYLA